MSKRVEVFVAGCPCCDEAVELVRSLACGSCDVQLLDMRTDPEVQEKAREYGVKRVPAVAVNGRLAGCCEGGVDAETLGALGVGQGAVTEGRPGAEVNLGRCSNPPGRDPPSDRL